jgi:hypothetical protein
MQHEIIKGRLLDGFGQLAEAGFAHEPLKTYDRADIKTPKWRIKEWDYYYIGNTKHGLSLTISDLGYISMIGITFFDFKQPKEYSKSFIGLFPMGKIKLAPSPGDNKVHVSSKQYDITIETTGAIRKLSGYVKNVAKLGDIKFNLTLTDTNGTGLCIATPFKKKGHFYYNYKLNNLRADGSVSFAGTIHDFEGAQGVLDWGRGVWTYKNTWYWASFSGISGSNVVGANLGYGFGDTSKASENMVYYRHNDGESPTVATKLDDVTFYIPKDGKGRDAFMEEWLIKSTSGDIDLRFKPLLNRHSISNLLLIKSIQNQVFGFYSGTILCDGKPLHIDHVLGFAEKVYNAW